MSSINKDYVTTLVEEDKKASLTPYDLFDRVINLRLYTSKDEVYTIRSDYESYYPAMYEHITSNDYRAFDFMRECQIRKCQHKPSIRIDYRRVSLGAVVEVDIYVKNFYMFSKSGKLIAGFNAQGYKLQQIEVSLGYFSQFQALFSDLKADVEPKDLFTVGFGDNIGRGVSRIVISNVEYTQLDKLPPDFTLHIHGYVGNLLTTKAEQAGIEKKKEVTEEELESEEPVTFDKIVSSDKVIEAESSMVSSDTEEASTDEKEPDEPTYLEQALNKIVTSKWFNQKITIDKILTDTSATDTTVSTGVKILLSTKARVYSNQEVNSMFKKDADGNIILPKITLPEKENVVATINNFCNTMGLQNFANTVMDTTGNVVLFLKNELNKIEELVSTPELKKEITLTPLSKYWGNVIPAVYNISIDAKCTITCPFFCFINPFEKLYFKSRYALGGEVSYYANKDVKEDTFFVLWENVSFATVEDINECTIVCTGSKEGE